MRILIGAIQADNVANSRKKIDGKWRVARPVPYRSIFSRMKMAWDVFTCKADAIYFYKQ